VIREDKHFLDGKSMSTERLYYEDSYTLTFNAQVIEQTTYKGRPALVLDRSYFYPEGGGQLADTGQLNAVSVVDVQVRDADQAVLHIVERPLSDKHVEGQIDAARRTDHMQHHSGQHVLSQALSQAAHAETVSVHMGADNMTIDVNRANLSLDEWLAIEALANRIVFEDRPVRTWFPEANELATLALRKLPDVVGKVRVIDIGGFDITACGGTHVARSGEIGIIKVVRFERHGEATRLEFKCGGRAVEDYRNKNQVINHLASELSVGYRDLPEAVTRIQAENKILKADLKTARERLVDSEALALLASAPNLGDYHIVKQVFEGRDPAELRLLAQKLTTHPGVIALLGTAGDTAQIIFGRSEDAMPDMAQALKTALAYLHTDRGGGRSNFAQGGGVPATLEEVTAALNLAEQSVREQN
jgi:alanyl-tRNA synthetase